MHRSNPHKADAAGRGQGSRCAVFHGVQNGRFSRIVTVMLDPDLSGQKNVLALNTGLFDGRTYLCLVEIALRRINSTIADLQCIQYAAFAFLLRHLKHAVA